MFNRILVFVYTICQCSSIVHELHDLHGWGFNVYIITQFMCLQGLYIYVETVPIRIRSICKLCVYTIQIFWYTSCLHRLRVSEHYVIWATFHFLWFIWLCLIRRIFCLFYKLYCWQTIWNIFWLIWMMQFFESWIYRWIFRILGKWGIEFICNTIIGMVAIKIQISRRKYIYLYIQLFRTRE